MTINKRKMLSLIILILVGAVVFQRQALFIKDSHNIEINAELKEVRKIRADSDEVLVFENTIAINSGGNISVENLDGSKYSISASSDSVMYKGEGPLMIIDKKKGSIIQYDEAGHIIRAIYGVGNIDEAQNFSDGSVVCQLADKSSIVVFNKNGQRSCFIQLPNEKILKVIGNPRSKNILVLTLNDSDGSITNKAYLYNFDGEVVSQASFSSLIIDGYLLEDKSIILTSSSISYFDLDFDLINRVTTDEIKAINRSGKKMFLTHQINDSDVTYYKFSIFDLVTEKFVIERRMPRVYDKIKYTDGLVLVYFQDKFIILNDSGVIIYEGSNRNVISNAFWLENKNLVLIDDKFATIYELKY